MIRRTQNKRWPTIKARRYAGDESTFSDLFPHGHAHNTDLLDPSQSLSSRLARGRRLSSLLSATATVCASCVEKSWPPPQKPRPQPPPRERLRRHPKRSTNASIAIAPSVAANIEAGMSDRVSLATLCFDLVPEKADEGHSCPLCWLQVTANNHPAIKPQPPLPRPSLHSLIDLSCRYEGASLQMPKMSKHLRSSRSPAPPRPNRACQRWRSASSV